MTERVDAFVSMSHYSAHVRPILDALPSELRGDLYAESHTVIRDIRGPALAGTPPRGRYPVLVAGFQDLTRFARPGVLVQHGAGQTYQGCETPAAAGGSNHEAATLHIVPSRRVGDLEAARYPNARIAVVGCPKLDAWARVPQPRNDPPVVAVTFHWPQHLNTVAGQPVPEAGWAWESNRAMVEQAVATKALSIVGHSHPRARQNLVAWYAMMGVEYVPHAEDLLPRVDCLLVDNSSIAFEWSALGRPVVFMRGENWTATKHGLRFGELLPGPELRAGASVADLLDAVDESIHEPKWSAARRAVTERVYDGLVDGRASERAAAAIMDLVAACG